MAAIDLRRLPSSTEATLCRGEGYFPVVVNPSGQMLLAVLRGGAGHIGIRGRLDAVRSEDGGRTWQAPAVVVDGEADDRNPAVGLAPDGAVVLAYHAQASYDEAGRWAGELGRAQMRIMRSADGGASWEAPEPLGFAPLEKHSAYGRILTMPDGTMLLPIYGREMGAVARSRDHAYLLRSADGGRTWDRPSLIAAGYNETALLRLPDRDLLASVRSDDRGGLLAVTRSSDGGNTWSEPEAVTGEREHPADLTLLSNGWVWMVFGVRHAPFGVQGLLSRDGGRTWGDRAVICDDLGESDLGYPSTVRVGDRLVTVYYRAALGWAPGREDGEPYARALGYSERELIEAVNGPARRGGRPRSGG